MFPRCELPDTDYWNGYRPEHPDRFDPHDFDPTDNPNIGGGASSTVNDYSKVLLMHLHDGVCGEERVLSPEMVRSMQRDLVPDGVPMPS